MAQTLGAPSSQSLCVAAYVSLAFTKSLIRTLVACNSDYKWGKARLAPFVIKFYRPCLLRSIAALRPSSSERSPSSPTARTAGGSAEGLQVSQKSCCACTTS